MKLISFIFSFVMTVSSYGAGSGGGSVMDLKWPAVNLFLLFSLLLWKIKKPMKEMFDKNAEDVSSLFELADKKDKEAEVKLQAYRDKFNNLPSEKEKILLESEQEAQAYHKKTQSETTEYINRITKDVDTKIEYEKSVYTREMSESLIDEVIKQTKTSILSNNDFKKKATDKLVARI